MKKLILIALVAISCAVARDCRYEEQELNSLIRQYEDLKDDYNANRQAINSKYVNEILANQMFNPRKNPYETLIRETQEINVLTDRYNVRFNRLNQRIEQAKQQLNNCRRKK
ncbi:hypothetical protein ACWIUD_10930 [Helicobacter sp. 23-1044]